MNFANSLGIASPELFNKQTLKGLISKKLEEREAAYPGKISPETKPEVVKFLTQKPSAGFNGQTAMYVSYVKDLIISGLTPDEALTIIKKVKKELE